MAYIAPAGTWLTLGDVGRGLAAGWRDPGAATSLCAGLSQLSHSARAWAFVSGRAAMTFALGVLARHAESGRNRVIVPAYTCYSVPAAVERAGLVPQPCDMDPATLSLDLDHLAQLAGTDTLAIVSANLFGIPNALSDIEALARARGIAMLDDAAQALGAKLHDRAVGGFGDLGLFSFDKGKNISTIQGGALLVRDGPWVGAFDASIGELAPSGALDTALTVAKLAPYSLFLRPSGYAFVRRIPLLGLGETRYDLTYPITGLSPVLAGLAGLQLARLPELTRVRRANAGALRSALEDLPNVRAIELAAEAEPAFPRYPVRARSAQARQRILARLHRDGIGASAFYPRALVDVPAVARHGIPTAHSYAGAREIADTIVTLPTHAWCPDDLALRVRAAFAADLEP